MLLVPQKAPCYVAAALGTGERTKDATYTKYQRTTINTSYCIRVCFKACT